MLIFSGFGPMLAAWIGFQMRVDTCLPGPEIADRHGSPGLRLKEARDALVAAMEHLGDIDPSVYSEAERMK